MVNNSHNCNSAHNKLVLVDNRYWRDTLDSSTKTLQHEHLVNGNVAGHDNVRLVALGLSDSRERDAGATDRALEKHTACVRVEKATRLGVFDNLQRDAVLDATTWVEELGLAHDLDAQRVGQRVDADEGGVADETDDAVYDLIRAQLNGTLGD